MQLYDILMEQNFDYKGNNSTQLPIAFLRKTSTIQSIGFEYFF